MKTALDYALESLQEQGIINLPSKLVEKQAKVQDKLAQKQAKLTPQTNLESDTLLSMADSDTITTTRYDSLRMGLEGMPMIDGVEVPHSNNPYDMYGAPKSTRKQYQKSDKSMAAQRELTANLLNSKFGTELTADTVTEQDMKDVGQYQTIDQLAAIGGDSEWEAPLIRNSSPINLTGKYINEAGNKESIPLNVPMTTNSYDVDATGRGLGAYGDSEGTDVTTDRMLDPSFNSTLYNPSFNKYAKNEELARVLTTNQPEKPMSALDRAVAMTKADKEAERANETLVDKVVDRTSNSLRALGYTLSEGVINTIDLVPEIVEFAYGNMVGDKKWSESTGMYDDEDSKAFKDWIGYNDEVVNELGKEGTEAVKAAWEEGDYWGLAEVAAKTITTPEMLAVSIGYVAGMVLPGAAAKKAITMASGVNKTANALVAADKTGKLTKAQAIAKAEDKAGAGYKVAKAMAGNVGYVAEAEQFGRDAEKLYAETYNEEMPTSQKFIVRPLGLLYAKLDGLTALAILKGTDPVTKAIPGMLEKLPTAMKEVFAGKVAAITGNTAKAVGVFGLEGTTEAMQTAMEKVAGKYNSEQDVGVGDVLEESAYEIGGAGLLGGAGGTQMQIAANSPAIAKSVYGAVEAPLRNLTDRAEQTVNETNTVPPTDIAATGSNDEGVAIDPATAEDNAMQVSAAKGVLANAGPISIKSDTTDLVSIVNQADIIASKGTEEESNEVSTTRKEAMELLSKQATDAVVYYLTKDNKTAEGEFRDEAAFTKAAEIVGSNLAAWGLSKEAKSEVLGAVLVGSAKLGSDADFNMDDIADMDDFDMFSGLDDSDIGSMDAFMSDMGFDDIDPNMMDDAESYIADNAQDQSGIDFDNYAFDDFVPPEDAQDTQDTNTNQESTSSEKATNTGKTKKKTIPKTDEQAAENVENTINTKIEEAKNYQDDTYTYGTSKGTVGKLVKALKLSDKEVEAAINSAFQTIKIRKMDKVSKAANNKQRELFYGGKKGSDFKGIIPTYLAYKKALQNGDSTTAIENIKSLQRVGSIKETSFKKLETAYNEIRSTIEEEMKRLTPQELKDDGGTDKARELIAKSLPKSKTFDGVSVDPMDVLQDFTEEGSSKASQELANRREIVTQLDSALESESTAFTRAKDQGRVVTLKDDLDIARTTLEEAKATVTKLTPVAGSKPRKGAVTKLKEAKKKVSNYTEKINRLEQTIKTIDDYESGLDTADDAPYTLKNRWVSVVDKEEDPETIQWVKDNLGLKVGEKKVQDNTLKTTVDAVSKTSVESTYTKEELDSAISDLSAKVDTFDTTGKGLGEMRKSILFKGLPTDTIDNVRKLIEDGKGKQLLTEISTAQTNIRAGFEVKPATGVQATEVTEVVPTIDKNDVTATVKELKEVEEKIEDTNKEQVTTKKEIDTTKTEKEGKITKYLKTEENIKAYKKATGTIKKLTKILTDLQDKQTAAKEKVEAAKKAVDKAERALNKYTDDFMSSITEEDMANIDTAADNIDNYKGKSKDFAMKVKQLLNKMDKAVKWAVNKVRAALDKRAHAKALKALADAETWSTAVNAEIQTKGQDAKTKIDEAKKKKIDLLMKADKRVTPTSAKKKDDEITRLTKIIDKMYDRLKAGTTNMYELRAKKKEVLGKLKGSVLVEDLVSTGPGFNKEAYTFNNGGIQPKDMTGLLTVNKSIVGRLDREDLLKLLPKGIRGSMRTEFNRVDTAMKGILATGTFKDKMIDNYQVVDSPASAIVFKAKPDGKNPVIQDTFVNAATLVLTDFAGIGLGELLFNTPDDIARMVDKHNGGMLNEGERQLLSRGGFKKVIANKLAEQTLSTMGIKQSDTIQQEHFDKFKADLGQMLLLTLQQMGHIEPLKDSVISELDWETKINERDEKEVLAEINRNGVDKSIGMVYSKKDKKEEYKRLEALSKEVTTALDIEPFQKNYLEVAPKTKDKKYTVRGSITDVPEDSQKILRVIEKEEYTLSTEGLDNFMSMYSSRDDYLANRKWKDTDKMLEEAKYSQEDIDAQEGKNREIESEYDAIMDLKDKIDNGHMQNKMWFNWFFSKNGRFFLDSTGINPQTNKLLHRWLIVPANAMRDWDMKDDRDAIEFKIAITQAFGFDIDKENTANIEKRFTEIVELSTSERMDLAKKSEHPGHAAMGLNALTKYDAASDGKFTVVMGAEFDAVTSGFAIKSLQIPLLDDKYEWLAKTGIIKKGKDYGKLDIDMDKLLDEKYGTNDIIASDGFLDAYKSLASGVAGGKGSIEVIDFEGEVDEKHTALLKSLLANGRVDEIVDNKGNVTSFGRNLFKYPFMTFNYAASISSIRKSIADSLAKSVIRDILDPDKEVSDDVLRGLGIHNRETFRDKVVANKEDSSKSQDITKLKEYKTLVTTFDGSYGRMTDEFMTKQFEPLVEANTAIMDATQVMFQAYKIAYDKAVDAKLASKEDGLGLTKVEVVELTRGLADKFPLIKAPKSVEAIEGIPVVSTKRVEASRGKLGNAQTKYKTNNKNGYASLVIQAMTSEYEQARASGAVLPIHWLDGNIIGEVLKKGGVLGVHDAIVTYHKFLQNAQDMNKATYETNRDYNLLENVLESLEASIGDLSTEKLRELVGDSEKDGIEVMQTLIELVEDNNDARDELYNGTMVVGNVAGSAGSMYKAVSRDTDDITGILTGKNSDKVDLMAIINKAIEEC